MSDELPYVSEEDWNKTPDSVKKLVHALFRKVEEQQKQIEALTKRVSELEEQLKLNSKNSNKPPSSDSSTKPTSSGKKQVGRKKRKRGGQPGSKGKSRELLPTDQVDNVIVCKPTECRSCHHALEGNSTKPGRHQVYELPPIKPIVTEYQFHSLSCPNCGQVNAAPWPAGVPESGYGPRLTSFIGICSGRFQLSKRMTLELMEACFRVPGSVGTVCASEDRVGQALKAPYEEVQKAIQNAAFVNADETGFRQSGKKGWLWILTTNQMSLFRLDSSRGGRVFQELLGENFQGIVGTDRWAGYNSLEPEQRQFCWAHLRREFERWKLRDEESKELGEKILHQVNSMFVLINRWRDGTLSRVWLCRKMKRIQDELRFRFQQGVDCSHKKTASTSKQLLKNWASLWVFLDHENVEPTNNLAERQLRPAVIYRKRCFGVDSSRGARFLERIFSTVSTLQLQGRNLLDFVTEAVSAMWEGRKPPSLLPT